MSFPRLQRDIARFFLSLGSNLLLVRPLRALDSRFTAKFAEGDKITLMVLPGRLTSPKSHAAHHCPQTKKQSLHFSNSILPPSVLLDALIFLPRPPKKIILLSSPLQSHDTNHSALSHLQAMLHENTPSQRPLPPPFITWLNSSVTHRHVRHPTLPPPASCRELSAPFFFVPARMIAAIPVHGIKMPREASF